MIIKEFKAFAPTVSAPNCNPDNYALNPDNYTLLSGEKTEAQDINYLSVILQLTGGRLRSPYSKLYCFMVLAAISHLIILFFSLHKLLICRFLHTPSNLASIKSLVLDYPTIENTDSFLWCRILMDLNVLCESSSSGCN